ncbi:MAG: 4Fe-4S dicluster domain-containing protein [Dehalococcoidia bacterium]|jgi:heterodisulfide reductase subunit C|nr:4Fe-4S dicluster domain-containing protein [Chloroflexota bacterium]MCK4242110.1 4Fe-4S dicluster domain-containing protein [Dehalococcoidia bacterium]
MITLNNLDTKFKYEVAEEPGGENIKLCFACGLCTAGCPVSEIDPEYNPRRIIHMVLLGMREEVLSSNLIWLCSLCYTCQAHCPQNVNFADVMKALRNMAVREGYVHPSFANRIKDIDTFSQRLRHQMVSSVVDRKSEEMELEPAKLAEEALKGLKTKV